MTITRLTILAAALAALAVALAPVAAAKNGDGVRVRGACTNASTAKLKLSREDGGRIEVEFEVDQNRNGVRWNVTLHRNGARVASTTATTRGPSGSFEVRRLIASGAATARITAAATRAGERCSARAAV
jgi:hypothetical protein